MIVLLLRLRERDHHVPQVNEQYYDTAQIFSVKVDLHALDQCKLDDQTSLVLGSVVRLQGLWWRRVHWISKLSAITRDDGMRALRSCVVGDCRKRITTGSGAAQRERR
jgi:hypothetical protein